MGTPCVRDRQCASPNPEDPASYCVDGVCCNDACTDPCEACDVENHVGACTVVGSPQDEEKQKPHGARTCTGEGDGTGPCAGYCNGNVDADCVFPGDETSSQDPECACLDADCSSGGAILTHFVCNKNGGSTTKSERCGGEAGGFRCESGGACKSACTSDSDCIADFICDTGACADLLVVGPLCDGDHVLRVADADDQDCSPYRCPAGDKQCPTSCKAVDDCVGGTVCNAAGQCVAQLDPPEVPSCSCRLAGSPREQGSSSPWPLALGALAAAACRRRRPARQKASF